MSNDDVILNKILSKVKNNIIKEDDLFDMLYDDLSDVMRFPEICEKLIQKGIRIQSGGSDDKNNFVQLNQNAVVDNTKSKIQKTEVNNASFYYEEKTIGLDRTSTFIDDMETIILSRKKSKCHDSTKINAEKIISNKNSIEPVTSNIAIIINDPHIRKRILYSEILKKWNFSKKELVCSKGYWVLDKRVVCWMTAYNDVKGIVFVWDELANEYIHFSNGSMIIKAVICRDYVYKLCKSSSFFSGVRLFRVSIDNLNSSEVGVEIPLNISYDIDRYKIDKYDLWSDGKNIEVRYKKQIIRI